MTVSPFINLPTATTLPYTYKPMPSSLPPSVTGITSTSADGAPADPSSANADGGGGGVGGSSSNSSSKPRYVISQSGHAAHPSDIISSCRALQAHVAKLQADAERDLRDLDERIRARELAEKRRVAPGWLDSDARLLEPERAPGTPDPTTTTMTMTTAGAAAAEGATASEQLQGLSMGGVGEQAPEQQLSEMAAHDEEGAQMDRAFGSLAIRPK